MESPNMTAARPAPAPGAGSAQASHTPIDVNNGTNLIARAEALNAFMRMQPAANQARLANAVSASGVPAAAESPPSSAVQSSCLCFGRGAAAAAANASSGTSPPSSTGGASLKPAREYYPDNLSVQPKPHPWENGMEWLIVACIDLLERHGLHEHNLFAVSAVDDLVRQLSIGVKVALPARTDPHVAAGAIKAKIRHANEPLVDRQCLRTFIDESSKLQQQQQQLLQDGQGGGGGETGQGRNPGHEQGDDGGGTGGGGGGGGAVNGVGSTLAVASHSGKRFSESYLAKTIEATRNGRGARRAYILGRLMRLLGRVSANVEQSRMGSHSLAKCVAPSMLHWDPNTNFALLMLGRITAYVMTMIEDARVFDENLCMKIDELAEAGGW